MNKSCLPHELTDPYPGWPSILKNFVLRGHPAIPCGQFPFSKGSLRHLSLLSQPGSRTNAAPDIPSVVSELRHAARLVHASGVAKTSSRSSDLLGAPMGLRISHTHVAKTYDSDRIQSEISTEDSMGGRSGAPGASFQGPLPVESERMSIIPPK